MKNAGVAASIGVALATVAPALGAQDEPEFSGTVICRVALAEGADTSSGHVIQALLPDGTPVSISAMQDWSDVMGIPSVAAVDALLQRWSDGATYNRLRVSFNGRLHATGLIGGVAIPSIQVHLPCYTGNFYNDTTERLLVFSEMRGLSIGPGENEADLRVGEVPFPLASQCTSSELHLSNDGFAAYYRADASVLDPGENAFLSFDFGVSGWSSAATYVEGEFLLELLPVVGDPLSGSCTSGPPIPLLEVAGSAVPGGTLRLVVEVLPGLSAFAVLGLGPGSIVLTPVCRPMLTPAHVLVGPIVAPSGGTVGYSMQVPPTAPIGMVADVQAFVRTPTTRPVRSSSLTAGVPPATSPAYAASDIVRLTIQ